MCMVVYVLDSHTKRSSVLILLHHHFLILESDFFSRLYEYLGYRMERCFTSGHKTQFVLLFLRNIFALMYDPICVCC